MTRTPTRSLHGERSNAYLSWIAIAVVCLLGGVAVLQGHVHDVLFAATVVTVTLVPIVALRSKRAALPWEVTAIAIAPLLASAVAPDLWYRQLILYAGAAPIALALTLQVHALTEVRLERWLAIAFVTMVSASVAAIWTTLTWTWDLIDGAAILASNAEAMWLLITATTAGIVAGMGFDLYYRHFPGEELVSAPTDGFDEELFANKADIDDHPPLSDVLALSERGQFALVNLLRLGIAAILGYAIVTFDTGAISNAAAMLAVTFVPTILRRRYGVPFDAGLVLWITLVVFAHAIGSFYIYDRSFWWHNLTHPLSATLVGGIGYVAIRILDEHRDEIHLPPALTPGFIVIFVLSFGVFWEIGEFGFDVVATLTGLEMPLAQHGLDDTMTDIIFNTIGAIVVARWGLPYLTDLTDDLTDRLDGWSVLEQ